jgi:MFS family permease
MENTMADPTASPPRPPTLIDRLLVNRNFAFFWAGEIISTVGDYSFGITMVLWIVLVIAQGQTWAAEAVAGYALSGAIPLLFIGPIVGVFVDRWNRLVTMLISNVVQAVLVGALFATTFWPGGHLPIFWQLGAIYVVNFLLVTADQFFNQAGNPLVQEIVPDQHFGRAIGRIMTYVYIGTIIGPSIGAAIFGFFGPQWALLLDIGTFAFSTAMLVFVRVPKAAPSPAAAEVAAEAEPTTPAPAPVKKKSFLPEFIEGIRFVFTSRIIRTMLFAVAFETLGTAALPVANVFFVLGNLHSSAEYVGFLATALGLGAVLGSIIGPPIVERLSEARTFWLCLYADGIGLMIYSRLTNPYAAIGLLFVLGIVTAFFNLSFVPLMFRLTPREMMGRTTAVRVSFVTTANMLGTVAAGVLIATVFQGLHIVALGSVFGPVDTVLLLAGVISLLAGVYAMKNVFTPPATPQAATPVPVAEGIASPEAVAE